MECQFIGCRIIDHSLYYKKATITLIIIINLAYQKLFLNYQNKEGKVLRISQKNQNFVLLSLKTEYSIKIEQKYMANKKKDK